MMTSLNQNTTGQALAFLFARLILSLIFFMAGIFKVFELGPMNHAERYFLPYEDTFLPVWSLWVVGVTIPIVELIAGALLIVGFRTRDALIAIGAILLIVTYGHLLKKPLFSITGHNFPRTALMVAVFLLPAADDRFSIDSWIERQRETS